VDARTEGADARRARNPAPMSPVEPEPKEASAPRDDRRRPPEPRVASPGRREARPPRGRDKREKSRGGGVPHSSFTTWEPAEDPDDDKPIFVARDEKGTPIDASGEAKTETREREPEREREPREREPRERDRDPREREKEDDPSFAQIFVNVGRRDGARAGDLQKLLEDKGGISRDDTTGRIRVRDRMTFVSVKRELLEKAIAALAGEVIGGRTVVAEVARARTPA